MPRLGIRPQTRSWRKNPNILRLKPTSSNLRHSNIFFDFDNNQEAEILETISQETEFVHMTQSQKEFKLFIENEENDKSSKSP